ncbi:Rhomboid family protein [Microlunatus sagamiharensis]|uniref:Rhomboid family protein n=2 Tax=Microlunatus sagamiharensis TaxID=546874 RepID=A0A1H2LT01_9ACTN|nr:rhomboid family intramembrane serine protease [Microlunatus sagamiharensis]SDU83875.1 Rhomboid family protein [Microlunatus sagamiharensis]
MKSQPVRPLHAVLVMALLLAGLWVVEVLDQLSGNALDAYGIRAREVDGLPEIFTAPLLHAGWDHLASNSVPFFAFGLLVLLGGVARWVVSTLVSVVSSGLLAWLLTPAGTIVLGASGVIFGWLTYLLVRGVWSRRPGQVALAVVILLVYGGLLWGVLPGAAGVSWQAHLGGAVGGVVAAWALHRRDVPVRPPAPQVYGWRT